MAGRPLPFAFSTSPEQLGTTPITSVTTAGGGNTIVSFDPFPIVVGIVGTAWSLEIFHGGVWNQAIFTTGIDPTAIEHDFGVTIDPGDPWRLLVDNGAVQWTSPTDAPLIPQSGFVS